MSGGEGEVVEVKVDDDDNEDEIDEEDELWLGDYIEVLEEYLVELVEM
jgi:hypothetical protein